MAQSKLEKVAKAIITHMDVFSNIGFDQKFAPKPATATWEDYSKVEQDTARLAARSAIWAIEAMEDQTDQ